MGLSAMAATPDMDQAMRFANISGSMTTLQPDQWVGEQNLNGLGLSAADPEAIRAYGDAIAQSVGAIGGTIAALRNKNKSGRRSPPPAAFAPAGPVYSSDGGSVSGGMDTQRLLLYGGIAVAGILLLVLMMKKKKKDRGED